MGNALGRFVVFLSDIVMTNAHLGVLFVLYKMFRGSTLMKRVLFAFLSGFLFIPSFLPTDLHRSKGILFPIFKLLARLKGCRVIFDSPLHPNKQYIYCQHPHGKLGVGCVVFFSHPVFENAILCGSSDALRAPGFGVIARLRGRIQTVSREVLKTTLGLGHSIIILPGGVQEMLRCRPLSTKIHLFTHLGILRMALENNVPLVPCFNFMSNDEYENICPAAERTSYHMFGVPFPPVWVNRFKLPWPNSAPMALIVGTPLPSVEIPEGDAGTTMLLDYRTAYQEAVTELFNRYKIEFGMEHREIQWHNESITRTWSHRFTSTL